MQILLLDAKDALSENICTYLSTRGYIVDFYHRNAAIETTITTLTYHICLLDIDISYAIRFHSLLEIKKNFPNTPVIVMSSDYSIDTIQMAFSIGCSDYLKKPFDLKELELRIKRFIKPIIKPIFNPIPSLIVLSNHYSFDMSSSKLLYDGNVQIFTKNELLFLSLLISKRNQIVNEAEISQYVWNTTYIENTTIRSLISRIRKKMKENFIQSIRGFGYMWVDKHT